MPYCAIVMPGESEDLQDLEDHMTIGLATVEEMKQYAELAAEGYAMVHPEPISVYILNMNVELVPMEYDLDEVVPMPEMPQYGRRVVEQYLFRRH